MTVGDVIASLAGRALCALATSTEVESLSRARRHVAGTTLDEALRTVRRLTGGGLAVSLDLFGEGAADEDELAATVRGYREAAAALAGVDGDVHLEIVPSHLGLDLGLDGCGRRRRHCRPEPPAPRRGRRPIGDRSRRGECRCPPVGWDPTQKGGAAPPPGTDVAPRTVVTAADQGAYLGSADVAYPWGEPTGVAIVRLAHRVHAGGSAPVLATHDRVLREALPSAGVEMLLGVREDDAHELAARGVPVRIYAPYGDSWCRYWMHRAAESQGV